MSTWQPRRRRDSSPWNIHATGWFPRDSSPRPQAHLGYADADARDRGAPAPNGGAPLHCSFDVDACDPVVAPATGTAVRGGLTFREAHYLCEAAAATGHLGSLDVVEVNEGLANDDGATVDVALGLVASALGAVIL